MTVTPLRAAANTFAGVSGGFIPTARATETIPAAPSAPSSAPRCRFAGSCGSAAASGR